jgi:hypothetical protein
MVRAVTWQFLGNAALVIVLFNLVLLVILWARHMQIETRLRADQRRRVGIRPD